MRNRLRNRNRCRSRKESEHQVFKCKTQPTMPPVEVGCVWGRPLLSQGSEPGRSGLHSVGQLKSGLGKVRQGGADQRCRDVPTGCSGGLAGPGDKQAPTEARLRPEGRTRAKSQRREWSLCVGYQLCRPTAQLRAAKFLSEQTTYGNLI